MKMARTILMILLFCYSIIQAAISNNDQFNNRVTDVYQVSFGPSSLEADPGNPAFFVPIMISTSQPTCRVNLLLIYDPTLITPTLIAPGMFFQSFTYDLSIAGRIKISLITDLPPPPDVPPIIGDTTFAWISFRITPQDIGYDYMTHIFYYEDPFTPFPDNYFVLHDNTIISQPELSLLQADILIIHPIYGDININGYAYEIGDAVTFFNYFMGTVHFTRRQYANSDCNRDGLQATISDLVYLLRNINGDLTTSISDMVGQAANGINPAYRITPDYMGFDDLNRFDISIDSDKTIGGAFIECSFNNGAITPMAVALNEESDNIELNYEITPQGKINIILLNKNSSGSNSSPKTVAIFYKGPYSENAINISKTDFSDINGQRIDALVKVDNFQSSHSDSPTPSIVSLSGYPNPFNAEVLIDYYLPYPGNYQISVYDVLGRKVTTLFDGYKEAGPGSVHWNAHKVDSGILASGMYFVRLAGENSSKSLKLFYLK